MATLFVTKSRSYDEAIDNLDEIPILDEDFGGSPHNSKELEEMISNFSEDLIAKSFEFPAYLFDKDSIKRLTDQPGYEGLTIYFVKYKGRISVALIAVDKDKKPIVIKVQRVISSQILVEEGVFGEEDGTGHPPNKVNEFLKILESYSK